MALASYSVRRPGKSIEATLIGALKKLVDEDTEIISLFYGADISEKEAQETALKIEENFPDTEVELDYGGQPVYYYIASVE